MAQHDYDIANALFPAIRVDWNALAAAIISTNSGASLPAVTAQGMLALNTTDSILYQRNIDNDAWVKLGKLEADDTFTPYNGGVPIVELPDMTGNPNEVPVVAADALSIVYKNAADFATLFTLPMLGSANVFTADQTISSTDAGAAAGPILTLLRDSATPAIDDKLGMIKFSGEDSAGNLTEYASINVLIRDPANGSEDGVIEFDTIIAGTKATRWRLWGGLWADGLAELGQGTINAKGYYLDGVSVASLLAINPSSPINLRGDASANTGNARFTADTVYLLDSNNKLYQTPLNAQVTAAGGFPSAYPGAPDDNVTVPVGTDVDIYAIGRAAPLGVTAVTVDNTTDIITCNAHGLTANTPVQFTATVLPTGLTGSTTYYLRDVTTNTFKVSADPSGGAAVNITSDGTNVNVQEVTALLLCAAGVAPTLPSTYVAKQKLSTVRIENLGTFDTTFRQVGKKVWTSGAVKTVTMAAADTWQALTGLTGVPAIANTIGGWMASKDTATATGVGVCAEVLPTGAPSAANYHNADGASTGTFTNSPGILVLAGAGSWEIPQVVTRGMHVKGANTTANNFYFQNTWYLLP